MKHLQYNETFTHIIASKEEANGNESIGSIWVDTKTFSVETPIKDIIEWAKNCTGRLIISIDESTIFMKDDLSKLPF